MTQEEAHATIILRLVPEVNSQLRDRIRLRGDLARLLETILREVDLGKVPVAPVSFADGGQSTSVKLPLAEHDRVKRCAETRGVSLNSLLNAAIRSYLDSGSGAASGGKAH